MREAELMARDRWSSEDLAAFQRERVRALVAHAVTNSPYYLEVLGADTSACGGIHDIGMISAALWARRRSGSGRLLWKSIIYRS
jgi:hypothetical protein